MVLRLLLVTFALAFLFQCKSRSHNSSVRTITRDVSDGKVLHLHLYPHDALKIPILNYKDGEMLFGLFLCQEGSDENCELLARVTEQRLLKLIQYQLEKEQELNKKKVHEHAGSDPNSAQAQRKLNGQLEAMGLLLTQLEESLKKLETQLSQATQKSEKDDIEAKLVELKSTMKVTHSEIEEIRKELFLSQPVPDGSSRAEDFQKHYEENLKPLLLSEGVVSFEKLAALDVDGSNRHSLDLLYAHFLQLYQQKISSDWRYRKLKENEKTYRDINQILSLPVEELFRVFSGAEKFGPQQLGILGLSPSFPASSLQNTQNDLEADSFQNQINANFQPLSGGKGSLRLLFSNEAVMEWPLSAERRQIALPWKQSHWVCSVEFLEGFSSQLRDRDFLEFHDFFVYENIFTQKKGTAGFGMKPPKNPGSWHPVTGGIRIHSTNAFGQWHLQQDQYLADFSQGVEFTPFGKKQVPTKLRLKCGEDLKLLETGQVDWSAPFHQLYKTLVGKKNFYEWNTNTNKLKKTGRVTFFQTLYFGKNFFTENENWPK